MLDEDKMKKVLNLLKIFGMIVVAIGLMLGFADLKGFLKDKKKIEILNWVLHSNSGMSLELPAAKEFMKKFPPPQDEDVENLTHLAKSVMKYEIGGILNASVNYMRKDLTRTGHVATLPEIHNWAAETPYSWISWWVTLVGFIGLIETWYIEKD